MSVVEVDVSERCACGCFWIALGSDSQWHLPEAGTFSSSAEEAWLFHSEWCRDRSEEEDNPCECLLEPESE